MYRTYQRFIIKDQTTFEQAQATSYTFFIVELKSVFEFFFRNHKISNQKHKEKPKCPYQWKM